MEASQFLLLAHKQKIFRVCTQNRDPRIGLRKANKTLAIRDLLQSCVYNFFTFSFLSSYHFSSSIFTDRKSKYVVVKRNVACSWSYLVRALSPHCRRIVCSNLQWKYLIAPLQLQTKQPQLPVCCAFIERADSATSSTLAMWRLIRVPSTLLHLIWSLFFSITRVSAACHQIRIHLSQLLMATLIIVATTAVCTTISAQLLVLYSFFLSRIIYQPFVNWGMGINFYAETYSSTDAHIFTQGFVLQRNSLTLEHHQVVRWPVSWPQTPAKCWSKNKTIAVIDLDTTLPQQ